MKGFAKTVKEVAEMMKREDGDVEVISAILTDNQVITITLKGTYLNLKRKVGDIASGALVAENKDGKWVVVQQNTLDKLLEAPKVFTIFHQLLSLKKEY